MTDRGITPKLPRKNYKIQIAYGVLVFIIIILLFSNPGINKQFLIYLFILLGSFTLPGIYHNLNWKSLAKDYALIYESDPTLFISQPSIKGIYKDHPVQISIRYNFEHGHNVKYTEVNLTMQKSIADVVIFTSGKLSKESTNVSGNRRIDSAFNIISSSSAIPQAMLDDKYIQDALLAANSDDFFSNSIELLISKDTITFTISNTIYDREYLANLLDFLVYISKTIVNNPSTEFLQDQPVTSDQ